MRTDTLFADRADAGRRLAARLEHVRAEDPVVLGLPRGGVPVAFEVARALGAPLDVIVVRKLGVPFQPELAMGAIGEGDVRVVNDEVVRMAGVSSSELADVEARERVELDRRALLFRGGRPAVDLAGRTVVIVDDGIATGSTARAACQVARARGARRVVLATAVAPLGWSAMFEHDADECIALATPEHFRAVGQFYDEFTQTTDDEVIDHLDRAGGGATATGSGDPSGGRRARVERGRGGPCRSGPAARPPHGPAASDRCRRVRPRKREQSSQPAQPLRRLGPQPGRTGHPAVRSAHDRRGARPRQRVRHRTARRPAGAGNRVAPRATGCRRPPGRLLRRQVEDALGHWVLAGHFTMRPAEYAAVLVRLVAHGGPTSVRDAARLLIPGLLTEVCSGG